jgi:hypothetical protein
MFEKLKQSVIDYKKDYAINLENNLDITVPVKTGALKNSLKVSIEENKVKVEGLDYWYFTNFGTVNIPAQKWVDTAITMSFFDTKLRIK